MLLDLTSSNNRARMEAMQTKTRTRARDGETIKAMDRGIIRVMRHHPK